MVGSYSIRQKSKACTSFLEKEQEIQIKMTCGRWDVKVKVNLCFIYFEGSEDPIFSSKKIIENISLFFLVF